MVPTPPGCPVPQAFSRSSASAPRTSPIGMRSGRNRSEERTRSESEATPSLVRSATRFGRLALELAGVLDQHDAIGGLCDLRQQRIGECGLAGRGAAGHQDIAAIGYGRAQCLGLSRAHDASGDVVIEGEDRDSGFADREGRRRDNRREQSLKPLAGFGQFG